MYIPFENNITMANAYNDVTTFVRIENGNETCSVSIVRIPVTKKLTAVNPWLRPQSAGLNAFVLNTSALSTYRGQRKSRVYRIARSPKP